MMIKRVVLFLLVSFFAKAGQCQLLSVDAIISQNQIVNYKNQNLILVDFWATWCSPCIPATKQLEVVQESFKDDIFVISISDESSYKIKSFVKTKPIHLLIASDQSGDLIKKYDVSYRPFAVLLNKKGQVLWKGKPGDLSLKHIEKFIKSTRNLDSYKPELEELIKQKDNQGLIRTKSIYSNINTSTNSLYVDKINDLNIKDEYEFRGSIRNFIAMHNKCPLLLVDKNSDTEQEIGIRNIHQFSEKDGLIDSVLSKLNYVLISDSLIDYPCYKMEVEKSELLWDTSQLEWEANSPAYLLGEVNIECDNISIKDLSNVLSNLKKELIVYNGLDSSLHDFSFVHSEMNLMTDELKNTFGILVKRGTCNIIKYNLEHKQSKVSILKID